MSVYLDYLSGLSFSTQFDVLGYPVSFITLLLAALAAFILACFSPFDSKKPWRIAASKKWLKRFRSNKHNYSPRQRFTYLRKVDHFLWEEIIMSCFEERGYPIKRTKMTRDGGSDGFVTIDGNFIVVQTKRYKGSIAKAHVLALESLVNRNSQYDKGLFIHTGRSSAPILKHFKGSEHLELLSGVDAILDFLDGEIVSLFGVPLSKLNKR